MTCGLIRVGNREDTDLDLQKSLCRVGWVALSSCCSEDYEQSQSERLAGNSGALACWKEVTNMTREQLFKMTSLSTCAG
jgi:hypothetical protein